MTLKHNFLLDPHIRFLNHGSFGACPRPGFAAYQNWQRELERQPVEFLGRRALALLAEARSKLGRYLGCQPENLVYFPNPTIAINMVARSLDLSPGDEILTSDHEYGAMDRTWRFICKKTGAGYIQQPVPLPLGGQADFVEAFWQGVTPRTRVIFISHITSPTALIFPVEAICRRAREAGIISIIDGAHAPGQMAVNLEEIGADIYTGACHKWMLSPKGASFLYARPEVQGWLDPLVVSWGYDADPGFGSGHRFIDYHEWQGTRDLSAFLAVPAAIQFMADNHWDQVRAACHQLAVETRQKIDQFTGLEPICTEDWLGQMFAARLPPVEIQSLKERLYAEHHIEVPIMEWQGQPFMRVSIQAYNTQEDVEALMEGLAALL
ncbi:MAG: aminotransferase class V-fold PLP-dependent enzyme [Anaerolineales bacterium]|nr:aminotransferase class V-fold PLP-dependent enzyme [Anaerolineales bacterium]